MDQQNQNLLKSNLPESVETMLRSTASILGAQIEVRLADSSLLLRSHESSSCTLCSRSDREGHVDCLARRDGSSSSPLESSPAQQWTCPHGCEVVTMPVAVPIGSPASIVMIRPDQAGSESITVGRDQALEFLGSFSRMLSEHLALAHDLTSVNEELNRRGTELSLLHSISGAISEDLSLRQRLRGLVGQARSAIGADVAVIWLERPNVLECAHSGQQNEWACNGRKELRQIADLISRRLREEQRNIYSVSLSELGGDTISLDGQVHLTGLALRRDEHHDGVLFLIDRSESTWELKSGIRFLEAVSDRIAALLADNEHYESLKDFLMSTVRTLVSAIDAKDPYTSGHSERVNLLSMFLGKTIGLETLELETLRWASILHDIGKIGMPETILTKPGKLTPEEYEIVKEHPERGYRVLAPIRQLSAASLGVRCHHERIDGGGYPLGLKGDEIPLSARIIAVADTYDALTSNRSYRSLRTPDKAFEVIREVRGKQLDSMVVDVLDTLMPFIREHEVMLQPSRADAVHSAIGDPITDLP